MGGQDGYSDDQVSYDEESNSLLAGVKIHASEKWGLGVNLGYTTAEGGINPFDLPADDYVAITPPMSYDFSNTHTYSTIDIDRLNLDAMFKYKFTDSIWTRLWYSYIDYDDADPYLYDTSGSVSLLTLTAGFSF